MGLGLAAALSAATPAEAAGNAVRKGTMRIGAERLANIGARLDDPETAFFFSALTTLASQGQFTMQYPRAGFDYFIIDGLSVGGNAGVSFNTLGAGTFGLAVLPRVGYAFDLSKAIEFWPRGGIGVHFVDYGVGDDATGVLTLEGMFLIEIVPHALFEFGPFLDVAFGNNWPIETGGTAGLAIEF